MKYYQEVTEWNTNYEVPNHVYYMNDSKTKAVGYIPYGKKDLILFSTPFNIDTKGRKFSLLAKKAESDEVYFPSKENKNDEIVKVNGSAGKVYILKKSGTKWTCSCPGFQFRNKCKHSEEQNSK